MDSIRHIVRSSGFAVKSLVQSPPKVSAIASQLEECKVPYTLDPCRTCADPCEDGHAEWPRKFDIDRTGNMLGSVKPYGRQAIVATGASDWPREVTAVEETLASYLQAADEKLSPPKPHADDASPDGEAKLEVERETGKHTIPGVFKSADQTRLSVLNGSHHPPEDPTIATVLVLPDYKIITNIERSASGAEQVWKAALDPKVGRAGVLEESNAIKSWTLPYACVVLLCSHKTRDNRCGIAAPKLQAQLIQTLESKSYIVHTQPEDPTLWGPPLESLPGTQAEREEATLARLRGVESVGGADDSPMVLITQISHIGSHKYAGNVIIYTPAGSAVWYGRVSPHEIAAVVQNTIIEGKIMPDLLRGGMNLERGKGKSLLDW